MNRRTLPELREYVERCRVDGELVELDPVTARSLVDATGAVLLWGRIVTGELAGDDEALDRMAVALEVARARFVDPFVEPSTPPAALPAVGPSDRLRLDAELAELRARLRAVLPAWRRSWRRRRSS